MYASNKASAIEHLAKMRDDQFPLVLDIWTADDIRDAAEDEHELTDEEVEIVVSRLVKDFDSEFGINNEVINSAIERVVLERKD